MPRKQHSNYKIIYNFTYAKEDMRKIMEENFLKYIKKQLDKKCVQGDHNESI